MQPLLNEKAARWYMMMAIMSYLCSGIGAVGLVLFNVAIKTSSRSEYGFSIQVETFGSMNGTFTLAALVLGVIAGVVLRKKADLRIRWLPVLVALITILLSMFFTPIMT